MPDVVSNDELNALAAEYVLGTLDYEERKGATALLEVDATFRGIVRVWERRFGELHLMVEAVEPDPQLWARIKPKMAGVEQIAPAIPSHADQAGAAAAAAASPVDAAAAATADTAGTAPAPAAAAEPKAEPVAAEATATAITSAPADSKPAAIAEAELKLAELAALLPAAGEQAAAAPAAPPEPAEKADQEKQEQAEQAHEEGLHAHAPDAVLRGFVPPPPMSTRGSAAVVEKPGRSGGRGWMAATLAMALVAVVLAGLISAWRFFPERLPDRLRAYSVLNLAPPPPPAPAPKARPQLPAFDE